LAGGFKYCAGFGEISGVADSNKENKALRTRAEDILRAMLDYRNSGITINTLVAVHSEYAIPRCCGLTLLSSRRISMMFCASI